MNVWIEHVSTTQFEVCLQEYRNFTDIIAMYLWLVKIMSLFAGFRHYTQHSDVEAVSRTSFYENKNKFF